MSSSLISTLFYLLILTVAASGYYNNEDTEKKIAWANTALTGRLLYNRLLKEPGESHAVAGLPILAMIAQMAMHAEENKFRELTQWFNLNNKDEIRQVFSSIIQQFSNDTDANLTFKVFGDERGSLSPEFKQNFKVICDGDIEYVDYKNVCDATNRINFWFKKQFYKPAHNVINSDHLLNCGRGLILGTYMDTRTNWDHPFNPKGLVDLKFHKSIHEVYNVVGLYGNAHAKYAELATLNAKMLMMPLKKGIQHRVLYLYPNDPNDLLSILYKVQDPNVFNGAVAQLRTACLRLHVTIGQAHAVNKYSTYIPELNLDLSGFKEVYKTDDQPTNVFSTIQQLHLIADKVVRDGPIDTHACPEHNLPFVKFDHPFAYFVLNEHMSPIYGGVFYGH